MKLFDIVVYLELTYVTYSDSESNLELICFLSLINMVFLNLDFFITLLTAKISSSQTDGPYQLSLCVTAAVFSCRDNTSGDIMIRRFTENRPLKYCYI